MKIDIYAHVVPPKYKDILLNRSFALRDHVSHFPTLFDLDHRFRIMDKHPDVIQVLTLTPSGASVDDIAAPKEAAELAKKINDEVAELV